MVSSRRCQIGNIGFIASFPLLVQPARVIAAPVASSNASSQRRILPPAYARAQRSHECL
jgi:hypothetical protein